MLPLVTLTIRAIDSFGGRQETMVKSRSKEMKDGALLEVVYIFEGASKADVVDYYRCQKALSLKFSFLDSLRLSSKHSSLLVTRLTDENSRVI